MVRQAVASRSLQSVGYDPKTKTLEIEFHDGDIYEYKNVPDSTYQALLAADSKGGYFTQYIRDHFQYAKISK